MALELRHCQHHCIVCKHGV